MDNQRAPKTYEEARREFMTQMHGIHAVKEQMEEQVYQSVLKRLERDGYIKTSVRDGRQ